MSKNYTPPDRSTYDPGWNDIPLSVTAAMNTAASTTASKPRLNLNKRVAFPMQSATTSSSSNVKTTSEGLPLPYSTAKYQPPPAMNPALASEQSQPSVLAPPPVASINPIKNVSLLADSKQSESSNEPFDSMAAREFCHSIFMRLIDKMAKSIDAVKLTEMQKRMNLLNDMWLEDKFDEVVQQKLYDIGRALEKNDANAAEEEHRFLVTHHMNVVMQWATALRQIIHSTISDIESSSSNETDPAVLPTNQLNVVQFIDVTTKPIVLDATPPFLSQVPIIPVSTPVLAIDPATEHIASNIEKVNVNDQQSNDESNSSKPKSGRFGRILHL